MSRFRRGETFDRDQDGAPIVWLGLGASLLPELRCSPAALRKPLPRSGHRLQPICSLPLNSAAPIMRHRQPRRACGFGGAIRLSSLSIMRPKANHLMKTASMPPPASIFVSPSNSLAVPPRPLVTSIISEKERSPTRGTRSFFCAVRAFLSGSVDDFAFQDLSLHRQVSIIYTPNGPLIYRWEPNSDEKSPMQTRPIHASSAPKRLRPARRAPSP